MQYEMSQRVPPQFDEYGTTFWIPSQVEPSVALIGTSLPAIRQFIVGLRSKDWEKLTRSGQESYGLRRVDSSEVGLRSGETAVSAHM